MTNANPHSKVPQLLFASVLVAVATIATCAVIASQPVPVVDGPVKFAQPSSELNEPPTQKPDITVMPCKLWTNHNPAFTDPSICIDFDGSTLSLNRDAYVLCNNDSYDIGDSTELTLTPAMRQKFCK